MSPVLKDKVAVITGAGRGLGKAFALKYAEEGARLLLPDISLERAEGTVKEIKAKGGRAAAMMTDISSEEATKEMADRVMELYGRVDILVNNAAIWYGLDITPLDAGTVEDWERILKVNIIGTWLCCKAIAPLMARGGRRQDYQHRLQRGPGASGAGLPALCLQQGDGLYPDPRPGPGPGAVED